MQVVEMRKIEICGRDGNLRRWSCQNGIMRDAGASMHRGNRGGETAWNWNTNNVIINVLPRFTPSRFATED